MRFGESASGNFYDGLTSDILSKMPILLIRPTLTLTAEARRQLHF